MKPLLYLAYDGMLEPDQGLIERVLMFDGCTY